MADSKQQLPGKDGKPVFIPTKDEREAISLVLTDYIKGRNILQKTYNYFNGRNLLDCIDDWTKRWNGYIPESSPLLDATQSQIFLNFTRNAVIAYLAKVALTLAKPKFVAVNKKLGVNSTKFAEFLKDANTYSLNAESGDSKFFSAALETATKGTCITYEGYMKQEQDMEVPVKYDAVIGKVTTKKQKRVIYDDCYQEIHPIEDFFIGNPYQPDIQKQPFILPRKITTYSDAKAEFGHYPNFEYVKAGAYTLVAEATTFYRNTLATDLNQDQVEVLKWYSRILNRHIVLINGVPMYDGVIPFKDGKYPYAKAIHEPFGNDFFWGASLVNKIMGEQDLKNMVFNMMVDKTQGSLLPFGLTSDLDDLIEDEVLAPNKIRKVGDINKWKFETLPGINAGEVQMLSLIDKELNENTGGATGAGSSSSPRGGKLPVRQILLQQQESMQKLGFSTSYLEDYECDRTKLRVSHILQFYSIPKLSKVTGATPDEMKQLVYRDLTLNNVKLSDGRVGTRVIKLADKMDSAGRQKMADNLSVLEIMGEETGTPTEALAVDVSTFNDYNFDVQIIKNSTYERNQVLEQSSRMEFANWRLALAQAAPVNAPEIIKWVEESFDIDSARFEGQPGPQQDTAANAANGQPGGGGPSANPGSNAPGGGAQGGRPLSELTRTNNGSALAKATG